MTNEIPLSDEQVANIRNEFSRFDTDNNGHIDYQEFCNLLAVLSPKSDANYFEYGFSLIDDNKDGLINFEEFLDWWPEAEWEK